MTTILVCGSRDYQGIDASIFLESVLTAAPFDITTIVQGEATGADTIARQYALQHYIPNCGHPANWYKYGKRAGYLRNAAMLEHHPDITRVIAFIHKDLPTSRGTWMMCNLAYNRHIKVFVCDSRERTVTEFNPSDYDS